MRAPVSWCVLAFVATATLAGCAPYALVEPSRRSIADAYTVDPQIQWTSFKRDKIELWTVDGFVLHNVRFFQAIGDGEPLLPSTGDTKEPRASYRKSMTTTEIAELVLDTLYGRSTPENLRPAKFGEAAGFRFETSWTNKDGVKLKSMVAGAVLKNRLHLIAYDAVAIHYFAKYRPHVERVIESVRLQ